MRFDNIRETVAGIVRADVSILGVTHRATLIRVEQSGSVQIPVATLGDALDQILRYLPGIGVRPTVRMPGRPGDWLCLILPEPA